MHPNQTDLTFDGLLLRNQLQRKALYNKHTFEEELYIDTSMCCLVFRVIIGGYENGVVCERYIYEGDCLFDAANELFKSLDKAYRRNHQT